MAFVECPYLGFGVGLRHAYLDRFRAGRPEGIAWAEVVSENYLAWDDRKPRRYACELLEVRKHLPIVLHGTSLSIGSVDAVDKSYLTRLKELIQQVEPPWVSDHLCWTGTAGVTSHDLLPLPYTEEALNVVVTKVGQVQEFLGRRILLENVSSYLEFAHSEMPEWEFLSEVARRADCGILLDVNNIFVSSVNHGFDPLDYLQAVPVDRVGQIHLAGHCNRGSYRIDTHDEPVCEKVWALYRHAARRFGAVSTMIERDDKFPPWEELASEVREAQRIWTEENGKTRSRYPSTALSLHP